MSIFDNSTAFLQEPRASAIFEPPDQTKIYKHFSEDQDAFDQLVKTENFLHEMIKFFTPDDQLGYAGQPQTYNEILDELNNGESGEADPTAETQTSPYGIWGKLDERGKTDSDWGFGKGSVGSNLLYDPIFADNFWNFTDMAPNDSGPVTGEGLTDYSADWDRSRDFVNGLGGYSYYELVVDGRISDWGEHGKGAYYLLITMLESRRRVNNALTGIFGDPGWFSEENGGAKIIGSIDTYFANIKSAHYHNKSLLYMYFGALTNYSTILNAYVNGVTAKADGSIPENVTSIEFSAFNSFAHPDGDLLTHLDTYLNYLNQQIENTDDDNRKTQLQAEASNIYALRTEWLTSPSASIPWAMSGGQPIVNQVIGKEKSALKAGSYYETNWVAHFAGTMENFLDQDFQDATESFIMTMYDSDRYDSEKDSYDSKVKLAKDQVYGDKVAEGNANKRAAENKSKTNKASDRARSERKAMNKKLEQSAAAARKQRIGGSRPAPAKPKPKEKKS